MTSSNHRSPSMQPLNQCPLRPIPHSHSSDIATHHKRNARLIREELELERLTYGGGEYIPETDIVGDSSEGEERIEEPRSSRRQEEEEYASSSDEDVDDPEYLELVEREKIVDKYDKGPEGAEVDPWENPDFDLYRQTDRFGFVHKEGASKENQQNTRRRIEKEVRREKKWLLMIKEWQDLKAKKYNDEWEDKERERREREAKGGKTRGTTAPAKLFERVWKGIPEKLRSVVWPRLLGVDLYRKEKVFQDLLLRARLVSKDIKQIDLDINRTYRDHLAFRRRYDVKQQSLLNVLSAYSMYNTEVGYCQGMSQIVALFLMYMDEEDSFWCLHSLMVNSHHTMHGFFVPGFPKLARFEDHFKRVLKKSRPKIYKHLEKEGIPYIYLTKWWFGCFLDRVPFPLALRLWDLFLLEGDCVLTAMSLNIFKMHEKRIRKSHMETFMEFVQQSIAEDFGYSDDEVIFSLRETMDKLKSDRLLHPPPPSREDLPEVPTKALGPVLHRSMVDIRSDIAEIQSRCSRANSMAGGRSPHPSRRRNTTHTSSASTSTPSVVGRRNEKEKTLPHGSISIPVEIRPSPMSCSPLIRPSPLASSPPPDPYSNGLRPNGGSVPTRRSVYDNVNGESSSVRRVRDERTGHDVSILRDRSDLEDWEYGRRDGGTFETERVTHTANHVTYVTIGDDDLLPGKQSVV